MIATQFDPKKTRTTARECTRMCRGSKQSRLKRCPNVKTLSRRHMTARPVIAAAIAAGPRTVSAALSRQSVGCANAADTDIRVASDESTLGTLVQTICGLRWHRRTR